MLEQTKEYAEMAVNRLIMQYKEYSYLSDLIKQIEEKIFIAMAKIAKEKSIDLVQIKEGMDDYPEVISLEKQKQIYARLLNRVSDEMTFATPLIWMMYKHKAYQGTSTEIATIEDFRRHCQPVDYICGKRYRFLLQELDVKIDQESEFTGKAHLNELYFNEVILQASCDSDFMEKWLANEYFIADNRINKWNILS